MTIALYHGFTEIHFEMLGYFIEYIKLNNINITIFHTYPLFIWIDILGFINILIPCYICFINLY
mgnify:CR=1 FL=1